MLLLAHTFFVLAGIGHEGHFVKEIANKTGLNWADVTTTMFNNMTLASGTWIPMTDNFWLVAAIDGGIVILFLLAMFVTYIVNRFRQPWMPSQASIAAAHGRLWLDPIVTSYPRTSDRKPSSRREIMLTSSRR